jgi:hypothetical protein
MEEEGDAEVHETAREIEEAEQELAALSVCGRGTLMSEARSVLLIELYSGTEDRWQELVSIPRYLILTQASEADAQARKRYRWMLDSLWKLEGIDAVLKKM